MPQTSPDISYHTNYQLIFDSALQNYKEKTGEDLPSTPLFHTLETYRSSEDVIATLRQEVPAFDKSWRRNDGLTRWLDPTVRVVNAFSATIGSAIALVSLTEYALNLQTDTYLAVLPTWWGYLHWNRHPPFSKHLYEFHKVIEMSYSLRLQTLLALVEAFSLTFSSALRMPLGGWISILGFHQPQG